MQLLLSPASSLCMSFIQAADLVHAVYLSQPCHLPSSLQELLQELKHLKIKVEELENERNQYEWELKATKVKGSMRHLRRGGAVGVLLGGVTLRIPHNESVKVQTSPTSWYPD